MSGGMNKTSKGGVEPNPNIQAVNNIISSEKKPRINATVEKTAIIPQRKETFLTQRGGKIIQGIAEVTPQDNRRTLQSTLLLQKKKEMQQVQQQLEKRRLDFAKRMEECREKQDELRSKQKQIKERVAKFEKFLKENDAKRLRANAKAVVEKKLREQKEAELAAIQRQLQVELGKSKSVLKLIKQHQGYERYLQSIVDVLPPDYLNVHEPQINDILMRYKTLVETNQDLISVVQHNQDDIEKAQSTLLGLVKERNDLIMVYNSKLGMRQKTLDKLKQESAYLEEGLEERDNTGKERLRMLSETKLAIDDLYERIKDQNKMRVLTARKVELDQPEASGDMSKSAGLKSWLDKLHALQFRVLDLQDITQFDKGVNNQRKTVK
ncbi:Coiled-coil domain-containing protein 42 [Boothiomyces macroporosus]|uniref:Coiled-coil domain-containing protein 42 n=1 Tax=Boothiomyces macroporosus TaxID=261099 RepID=A0AAD5UG18_9FUNG|nr:Coiled-coil domain-containing protein 42 [Boothiomyces macroporosus]